MISQDSQLRPPWCSQKEAINKPIAEWELGIWLKGVQSKRVQKNTNFRDTEKEQRGELEKPVESKVESKKIGGAMIEGTITSQGKYANGKDICEIYIDTACSNRLPHSHGQKIPILISIGKNLYEAGVHETREGVVWISSVLHKQGQRVERVRLVEALGDIGLRKGDRVRIAASTDGTLSLQ